MNEREDTGTSAVLLRGLGDLLAIVDSQDVEDHPVALVQRRRELCLDVRLERRAGEWAINDARCNHFMAACIIDRGMGLTMAKGSACA
jgi:hypothetical protein